MKALITGITGFAGSHLAELLLNEGLEVTGTMRPRSRTENIDHIAGRVGLLNADIRDGYSMQQVIQKVNPNYIFHLAAQSFVHLSFQAPAETLITNIAGTLNVLEGARTLSTDPVVLVAGSSEEYGKVAPGDLPVTEATPLRPMSPYAVSKVASDQIACQYHYSYGLKAVITRAFNHTGPRRGESFVTSNFAKQIALIEAGRQEPVIRHGNVEATRDWTDVRDTVRGYWLAANQCKYGQPYNICSGREYPVRRILEELISMAKVNPVLQEDPERMRPSDIPRLKGSCKMFSGETGWKPHIPLETTLANLLDYWRERTNSTSDRRS